MDKIFHAIDPKTWERQIYFEYYHTQIKCKYNINANIDVTELLRFKCEHALKFFPTMLYVIMRAVNENREFRMAFNDKGELGYWDHLVPSYTLFHDESKTFTDIWSEYDPCFAVFYRTVLGDMERYGCVRGVIKAREGQPPNFCSVSCLPWLSFTGFAQDTYTESTMLTPLIRFGKYFTSPDGRTLLPLAVFVSHAVADGYHTCKLINEIEQMAGDPERYLDLNSR